MFAAATHAIKLTVPLTSDGLEEFTATLGSNLGGILPELVLVAGIVGLLLARLCTKGHTVPATLSTGVLILAGAAAVAALGNGQTDASFFGMIRSDSLAAFIKLLILLTTLLIGWLSLTTRTPLSEDSTDYFVVLLGAALGMCLMAGANDLVMLFVAMEMASLPCFCLAGFLRGNRAASEASLKYVVYGAAASGVMLYGISLLAGYYGTTNLPELAQRISMKAQATVVEPVAEPTGDDVVPPIVEDEETAAKPKHKAAASPSIPPILALGLLLLFVGLAFKLAVVPFHFWCPDVFEGASAEVAGFLSLASKSAAFAMALRVIFVLTGVWDYGAGMNPALLQPSAALFIGIVAAATATFGNLAAYVQTNIKRLLAYSTIAHAGYMLMGLAALSTDGASAVLFYLAVYVLMNLGAFAVVALVYRRIGSEDLKDYAGLGSRSPLLAAVMTIFMLSLVGIPPMAGFAAKFRLFAVLFQGHLYWLLAVGLVNTLLSLYYYVKVLRVMYITNPEDASATEPISAGPSGAILVLLLAVPVVLLGIYWGPLLDWVNRCAAAVTG